MSELPKFPEKEEQDTHTTGEGEYDWRQICLQMEEKLLKYQQWGTKLVAHLESLEKEFWEIKRYGKFEKGTAKTDSYGLDIWFSKFKKVKEAFTDA